MLEYQGNVFRDMKNLNEKHEYYRVFPDKNHLEIVFFLTQHNCCGLDHVSVRFQDDHGKYYVSFDSGPSLFGQKCEAFLHLCRPQESQFSKLNRDAQRYITANTDQPYDYHTFKIAVNADQVARIKSILPLPRASSDEVVVPESSGAWGKTSQCLAFIGSWFSRCCRCAHYNETSTTVFILEQVGLYNDLSPAAVWIRSVIAFCSSLLPSLLLWVGAFDDPQRDSTYETLVYFGAGMWLASLSGYFLYTIFSRMVQYSACCAPAKTTKTKFHDTIHRRRFCLWLDTIVVCSWMVVSATGSLLFFAPEILPDQDVNHTVDMTYLQGSAIVVSLSFAALLSQFLIDYCCNLRNGFLNPRMLQHTLYRAASQVDFASNDNIKELNEVSIGVQSNIDEKLMDVSL